MNLHTLGALDEHANIPKFRGRAKIDNFYKGSVQFLKI